MRGAGFNKPVLTASGSDKMLLHIGPDLKCRSGRVNQLIHIRTLPGADTAPKTDSESGRLLSNTVQRPFT